MDVVAVVAFVLLLLVLLVVGRLMYVLVIAPSKKTTTYAVGRDFARDTMVREQSLVRFLGLESGGEPSAGNGHLALSTAKLGYYTTKSSANLVVPLRQIRDVGLVEEHLGRSTGRPLLLIAFDTDAGRDSGAFHLPYPDEWKLAIENVLKNELY